MRRSALSGVEHVDVILRRALWVHCARHWDDHHARAGSAMGFTQPCTQISMTLILRFALAARASTSSRSDVSTVA
jgi:hypothetical protein